MTGAMQSHYRRAGITLVEVLVAIFVMALGLMALLTLFPLGALQMAQAIKDERTADEAANAYSVLQAYWRWRQETTPTPDSGLDSAMVSPPGLPSLVSSSGPSYPVLVDPLGYKTYPSAPTNYQNWVAGTPGGVPRISLDTLAGTGTIGAQYDQYFTSLDDLIFDPSTSGNPTAAPNGLPPSPIERTGHYSYSLLLRRIRSTDSRFLAVTVVVYKDRSIQSTQDTLTPPEASYLTQFTAGSTTATVYWASTQPTPNIHRDSWILDATMQEPNPQKSSDPPRGYFYRIISVSDPYQPQNPPGSLAVDVELQTPALAGYANYRGQGVIMDYVSEVFVKPVMGP